MKTLGLILLTIVAAIAFYLGWTLYQIVKQIRGDR